jgi:hypothetical protein
LDRCPRASASSRVRTSSCFFNSTSELGPLLTRAAAFVPAERSRVGLFVPLRDKVTSSACSIGCSPQAEDQVCLEMIAQARQVWVRPFTRPAGIDFAEW